MRDEESRRGENRERAAGRGKRKTNSCLSGPKRCFSDSLYASRMPSFVHYADFPSLEREERQIECLIEERKREGEGRKRRRRENRFRKKRKKKIYSILFETTRISPLYTAIAML
jgi:hypothetical protein